MFHSYLVISSSADQILAAAEALSQTKIKPHQDILILNSQPSIGIADIKALTKFLQFKPFQLPQKIVFIPQAGNLTLPAQNALLKTLEEPPPNSLIILAAPNLNSLIPTVVSRCQIKFLADLKPDPKFIQAEQAAFLAICRSSLAQKISLAQNYAASKTQALEFCFRQLQFLRQTYKYPELIKNILAIIDRLNANVHPKLCLENLFLSYPDVINS